MADNKVKTIDFYRGETVEFDEGPILFGGQVQDVSGDSVRLMTKANKSDPDSADIFNADTGVAADVATDGASGIVHFTITKTQSDVSVGSYHGEAVWEPVGGTERVVRQYVVICKERVEDVPGT